MMVVPVRVNNKIDNNHNKNSDNNDIDNNNNNNDNVENDIDSNQNHNHNNEMTREASASESTSALLSFSLWNFFQADHSPSSSSNTATPSSSSCNYYCSKAKASWYHHLQQHWKIIVLGQLLSLLLASGGAAQATLHFNCDLSSPTFTMAMVYLLLSLHLILLYNRQQKQPQQQQQQQTQHNCQWPCQKRRHLVNTNDEEIETKHLSQTQQQQQQQQQQKQQQTETETQTEQENDETTQQQQRIRNRIQYNGIQQSIYLQEQENETTCWNETETDHNPYYNSDIHSDTYSSSSSSLSSSYSYYYNWLKYPSLFGIIQLHRPVWQYMMLAFLDLQANAVTCLAFKYTTLTSVSLLDALAIPSAMIISKCFFDRRYTTIHILGVVVSMTGVILNVMQDYESDNHTNNSNNDDDDDNNNNDNTNDQMYYPHKFRGDILAITGGLLFGLTNTLVEVTVRHNSSDTMEYLGVMGFFGFIFSFFQALIFEYHDILKFFGRNPNGEESSSSSSSSKCSIAMGWWLYFIFCLVNVSSYMGGSYFLTISEAAYFSLSLLTGDLWSVLFSIVAEEMVPKPLFFLALLFVLSGVIIYEMAPSPVESDNIIIEDNGNDDNNDDNNNIDNNDNRDNDISEENPEESHFHYPIENNNFSKTLPEFS